MKNLSTILISAITAALISALFLHFQTTPSAPSIPEKPSVLANIVKTGTLRCGYVNWQPYYFVDLKDGNKEPQGLNVDIMNELAKVLDLKIVWAEEIGWGTIGEGFKTNRYDMVCTSMWVDPAKLKNLSLSRPIFYSAPHLYVRADDTRFDANADRINQPDVKIAVIDGSPLFHLVKESFPRAEMVALPQLVQDAEYLMTVAAKKADIAIMDPDEIKRYVETNPGKLKPIANIPPVRILPHVLALPQNNPDLTLMINAGLQVLIDNGVMEKIRKKYGTSYLVPVPSFRE